MQTMDTVLLLLLPLLLSSSLLIGTATAEAPLSFYCNSSSGTFAPSDPYGQNLDPLTPGFLEHLYVLENLDLVTIAPNTENTVVGLAMCRTDLPHSTCRACIADGMPQLRSACGNQREGIAWFDSCMVRYAPRDYYGVVEDGHRVALWNATTVPDPAAFNAKVAGLLKRVAAEAYRSEAVLFATEQADVVVGARKEKIYSMVQCTRDLRTPGCKKCLQDILGSFPSCCDGKMGGRVLAASCHFRYELYRFY